MNLTTAHILWVYRIASTTLIRKQTKDIAKRSSISFNNNWVCQQIVDISRLLILVEKTWGALCSLLVVGWSTLLTLPIRHDGTTFATIFGAK